MNDRCCKAEAPLNSTHEAYRHYRTMEAVRKLANASLQSAKAASDTADAVFRVADRELARLIHDNGRPLIADGRRGSLASVGDGLMVKWSKIESGSLTIGGHEMQAKEIAIEPDDQAILDNWSKAGPVDAFDEMDRRNDELATADFEVIETILDTPIGLGPLADPINYGGL